MKNFFNAAALAFVAGAAAGMMCPSAAKAEYYNYDTAFYGGYNPGYRSNGVSPVITASPSHYAMPVVSAVPTQAPWVDANPVHNWIIPTRFADLTIDELKYGPIRHYTLVVNGQPVLQINNQNTTLRVSQVYNLSGEDAVMVSTQSTQPGCTTRHYLVTVTAGAAHTAEIGHCAATYEADVTNNALFITFADTFAGWSTRNAWRYEGGQLKQM